MFQSLYRYLLELFFAVIVFVTVISFAKGFLKFLKFSSEMVL
jgi:hypothetical protein